MTSVTTQTVALKCFLYNIGMTCVTTHTLALKLFLLQHWYDLCYNTNSCFELFFLQHWYDLCYNTHNCCCCNTSCFFATLVWLVLQHKSVGLNVSSNIGMTCVTTQTVALKSFLQHWYDLCYNTHTCFEMFLATLVWLVLQHKQLVWIVSYNIGMTCVTTQTVGRNCFLQHWSWLVLQLTQLIWNVSSNIGHDLCYNTNSWSWIVSCNTSHDLCCKQTIGLTVSYNIVMLCYNTQLQETELFLETCLWLVLQHKHTIGTRIDSDPTFWLCVTPAIQLVWIISCNIGMTSVTTHSCFEMFLATLVWLLLQHTLLLWNVSCNIGMTCVTTHTVSFELFLATLEWLVLQHKHLVWIVSCNIGMTCVTTQTVGLNCLLQHWYDLCYNTNSWFELFIATLVWLVLQHKQLVWIVSCNIGMTCVTTQTVGLNYFLQHWYD